MANQTVYPYGTGGSLPSNIGIVNDFVTGGADKALSAEAGKNFYEEVFGFNGPVDLSQLSELNAIIAENGQGLPVWSLGSGGTCVLLPVNPGEKYTITANENYEANYTFLRETELPSVQYSTPLFASGYSGRVILPTGTSVDVVAPDDALTLYVRKTSSVGNNMLPFVSSGAVGLERKVDSIIEEIETTVQVTGDYFNLHESNGTMIRANVYMPIKSGCTVVVTEKGTNNYQYTLSSISVSEHTPTGTSIYGYKNGSNTSIVPEGGDYFILMFKNGSDAAVSVSDLLSAYDITVIYKEKIERPSLNDGEKRWDFFGAFKQGTKVVISDYLSIPKQFMTVRFVMPEWMRVRFNYGLRDIAGWTDYYYNGDTVTFTRAQSAIATEISFIDSRGTNPIVYDRDAVGNWVSFAILDENDGDVVVRNNDAEKYLGALRTTPDVAADLPVIVHTSDIHGDARRFNSVCDYADHLRADLLVNTGDNPFYLMSNGVLFHKEIVLAHKTDFANCIGNHDTYASSLSTIYDENILPFADDYGYHKATSSDVTDKCYFFKDLSSINIRVIALDLYDGLRNAAYKARVSQTQMEWFISTLASTPAGYGIVVIMHQAPHTISAITGKTDFNDSTMEPQIAAVDSDYMTNGKITGNPFGKIIDAFIEGVTISDSYTQKNTSGANETISYSADFTNLAEGVEFIAYLNGHTHRDFIGYVADCEHNQLNLNIASAAPISQSSGYKTPSDIYRDSVGANQDAFNVYTINRTDKTVGVARIGSNLSKDLRPRKVMFVRYADDE